MGGGARASTARQRSRGYRRRRGPCGRRCCANGNATAGRAGGLGRRIGLEYGDTRSGFQVCLPSIRCAPRSRFGSCTSDRRRRAGASVRRPRDREPRGPPSRVAGTTERGPKTRRVWLAWASHDRRLACTRTSRATASRTAARRGASIHGQLAELDVHVVRHQSVVLSAARGGPRHVQSTRLQDASRQRHGARHPSRPRRTWQLTTTSRHRDVAGAHPPSDHLRLGRHSGTGGISSPQRVRGPRLRGDAARDAAAQRAIRSTSRLRDGTIVATYRGGGRERAFTASSAVRQRADGASSDRSDGGALLDEGPVSIRTILRNRNGTRRVPGWGGSAHGLGGLTARATAGSRDAHPRPTA